MGFSYPSRLLGLRWTGPLFPAALHDTAADPGPAILAQRVDIALSDGRRILVEGPTSLASVMGLVRGLTA